MMNEEGFRLQVVGYRGKPSERSLSHDVRRGTQFPPLAYGLLPKAFFRDCVPNCRETRRALDVVALPSPPDHGLCSPHPK